MVGGTCGALRSLASGTAVAVGGLRRLGRGPLATFFGEDVVQTHVEVGVSDGYLFEVLDKFGSHCWGNVVGLKLTLV